MIPLSEREIEVIKDKDFLRIKRSALSKIEELLSQTQIVLSKSIHNSTHQFPLKTNFSPAKISRGENYRGLPYLVLDYPSTFSKENIFAFRTMFYWGNFFSVTIHLQGESLDHYRNRIAENFNFILGKNVFISVGETPWEYHYESDNYIPLLKEHQGLIEQSSFLKLSKKIELKNWEQVPEFAFEFLETLLGVLMPKNH